MDNTFTTYQRHVLGSIDFFSANLDDLVGLINQHVDNGKGGFCIGYVNPHVYNIAQDDVDVSSFLNQCNLVCVDGMGTAWALRAAHQSPGRRCVHRVVALNLFDALVSQLSTPATALLIGVEADTVRQSADTINRLNCAFTITDVLDGFRHDDEYKDFLDQHSDIAWVLIGAGTPRSERLALMARSHCPNAIVFHLGAGTIKVYAGSKRRAPRWVTRSGLEWAHRMLFEPHTRARYTVGGWQFAKHLLQLPGKQHSRHTS